MNTLIQIIKNVLSDKRITILIILAAIASRVLQLVYYFNIRLDMSHQVIATKNFLDGHGISMDTVKSTDLSIVIYEPLINWPPGYSLLIAPFYAIFGGDYNAAGMVLSISFGILLIFISRAILKLLDVPLYLLNLSTLVAGFFIYFFYLIASSDAIMIAIFCAGIYYLLLLLKTRQNITRNTVLIITCLFLCGLLKYLFIPIVFVIPAFLIWKGISDKDRLVKRSGIAIFASLVLLLGGLLVYQQMISGSVGYISEPKRGFFPDHLLAAYPFIPGSFIRTESIALLFENFNAVEGFLLNIFKVLHLVCLTGLTVWAIRRFTRSGAANISLNGNLFYITLFLSLALTFLLGILSIRVEKELFMSGHLWTYIEEQRYYGAATILIQLCAFVLYHYRHKKPIRYFCIIVFILFMAEVGRGILFDFNRIKNLNKEEYSWQYERRFQLYADSIIKKSLQLRNAEQVVVGGSFNYMNHRVSLFSRVPILRDPDSLNDLSSLRTSKTVMLLVILEEKEMADYPGFLSLKGKEVAGSFNGLYFYTVYVSPQQE